jgi:hypothetical protein
MANKENICPLGDCIYSYNDQPDLSIGKGDLLYVRLLGEIKAENQTTNNMIKEYRLLRLDGDFDVEGLQQSSVNNETRLLLDGYIVIGDSTWYGVKGMLDMSKGLFVVKELETTK